MLRARIAQSVNGDLLVVAARRAAKDHRRVRRQDRGDAFESAAELPGTRLRDRIVERDHETRSGRRQQPKFDQVPGLEVVGKRDGAEIVPKRCADARGDGQHGRHAGNDLKIDAAPGRGTGFDSLADCRRHGEHTGVAAGNHGHDRPGGSGVQRLASPGEFFAIVGGHGLLMLAEVEPVKIWLVAVEQRRVGHCLQGLRRDLVLIARPEAYDENLAGHPTASTCPGRDDQPGTRTIEK